jgi:hypothetical protein
VLRERDPGNDGEVLLVSRDAAKLYWIGDRIIPSETRYPAVLKNGAARGVGVVATSSSAISMKPPDPRFTSIPVSRMAGQRSFTDIGAAEPRLVVTAQLVFQPEKARTARVILHGGARARLQTGTHARTAKRPAVKRAVRDKRTSRLPSVKTWSRAAAAAMRRTPARQRRQGRTAARSLVPERPPCGCCWMAMSCLAENYPDSVLSAAGRRRGQTARAPHQPR